MRRIYELWFRKVFQPFLEAKTMTAALRPGDREFPNVKGTKAGDIAKIKIILSPGDENRRIEAILDSFEMPVRIESLAKKRIGDLTKEDFIGMSQDCQNTESAKLHLGLIYNRVFSDDDGITVIRWSFIEL